MRLNIRARSTGPRRSRWVLALVVTIAVAVVTVIIRISAEMVSSHSPGAPWVILGLQPSTFIWLFCGVVTITAGTILASVTEIVDSIPTVAEQFSSPNDDAAVAEPARVEPTREAYSPIAPSAVLAIQSTGLGQNAGALSTP